MRIYIGFDDTDTKDTERGTGRLARGFAAALPAGCQLRGIVRQQLPRLEGIPFTSNNSSACVIVEAADSQEDGLVAAAIAHLERCFVEGSDPGLCVLSEGHASAPALVAFGRECCHRRVSQDEARRAAGSAHLSGHGGTEDGIIGAAAGIGLTLSGWSGRFIEWGDLRGHPAAVTVGELEAAGIRVVATGRDEVVPWTGDTVDTGGWLRPRLWGGGPVLAVRRAAAGGWQVDGRKGDGQGAGDGTHGSSGGRSA